MSPLSLQNQFFPCVLGKNVHNVMLIFFYSNDYKMKGSYPWCSFEQSWSLYIHKTYKIRKKKNTLWESEKNNFLFSLWGSVSLCPGNDWAEKMKLFLHTVYITEVFSHLHHQLRPQSEVLLHPRGSQVQVAMLHAQSLWFLDTQTTKI